MKKKQIDIKWVLGFFAIAFALYSVISDAINYDLLRSHIEKMPANIKSIKIEDNTRLKYGLVKDKTIKSVLISILKEKNDSSLEGPEPVTPYHWIFYTIQLKNMQIIKLDVAIDKEKGMIRATKSFRGSHYRTLINDKEKEYSNVLLK